MLSSLGVDPKGKWEAGKRSKTMNTAKYFLCWLACVISLLCAGWNGRAPVNSVNFRRKAMQEGKAMSRKMFKLLTTVMRVNRVIREQIRQRTVHDPRYMADACRDCDDLIDMVTQRFNGVAW